MKQLVEHLVLWCHVAKAIKACKARACLTSGSASGLIAADMFMCTNGNLEIWPPVPEAID